MNMFQMCEDNLRKLESALPQIMDAAGLALNQADVQVLFDEVKEFLSNVRWNYSPPTSVEKDEP